MFEVLPKVAWPATPSVPVLEEFTKVAMPITFNVLERFVAPTTESAPVVETLARVV